MQVTTHQAGLDSSIARLALAQRIALAAFAIFLMLNAVTPFITPDPPWLANLPLEVAIMAFLLAFGQSHIRAERGRDVNAASPAKQGVDRRVSFPITRPGPYRPRAVSALTPNRLRTDRGGGPVLRPPGYSFGGHWILRSWLPRYGAEPN